MIKHAWSLVVFTCLAQLSVGVFLINKIFNFFSPFSYEVFEIEIFDRILILILVAISMLISFSHLGKPKNALFALRNIRKSWLSREIFFMSLLFSICLIDFILIFFGVNVIVGNMLSLIGVFSAFAFIHSMSKLYQIETVKTWASNYTLLSFFNTTFLLGTAFFIFVLIFSNITLERDWIIVPAVFTIFQLYLFSKRKSKQNSTKLIAVLAYSFAVVLFFSIVYFSFFPIWIFVFPLILILFSIFAERYLFFASYKSIGI